jgi:hypothetical protein
VGLIAQVSKNESIRAGDSKTTMSCEAGGGTSAPAADGLAALDDTALATLFEQLPGLGMSRELVVVVPAVSRRWRSVCRHLVSRSWMFSGYVQHAVTRPLMCACALTASQATAQPMLRIPSSLVPATAKYVIDTCTGASSVMGMACSAC